MVIRRVGRSGRLNGRGQAREAVTTVNGLARVLEGIGTLTYKTPRPANTEMHDPLGLTQEKGIRNMKGFQPFAFGMLAAAFIFLNTTHTAGATTSTCREFIDSKESVAGKSGDRVYVLSELLFQAGSKLYVYANNANLSVVTAKDGIHVREAGRPETVLASDAKVFPRTNVCIVPQGADVPAFLASRPPTYEIP